MPAAIKEKYLLRQRKRTYRGAYKDQETKRKKRPQEITETKRALQREEEFTEKPLTADR